MSSEQRHWTYGLKVGDVVVGNFPRSYRPDRGALNLITLTVEKIGRKWVTLSDLGVSYRVEIGQSRVDGLSSLGARIFMSADDFEADRERERVWQQIRKAVNSAPYRGPHCFVTTSDIREAARLLKLNIEGGQ